jgi:DNA adenine methylase
MSLIKKASRFIYLNRTCFNGLYRENSKGEFNVPYGKYKNPLICDEENILELSNFFKNKNITFCNQNYLDIINMAGPGDFVYLDPPYDIVNETSFTKYNKDDFSREDQKKLKKALDELTKRGGYFLLSNARTSFIEELYKDYTIDIVMAARNINSKGDERNKVEEVLIKNY